MFQSEYENLLSQLEKLPAFDSIVISSAGRIGAMRNHALRICKGLQLSGYSPLLLVAAPEKEKPEINYVFHSNIPVIELSVIRTRLERFHVSGYCRRIGCAFGEVLSVFLHRRQCRFVLCHGQNELLFTPACRVCREEKILVVGYPVEYPAKNLFSILTGQYFPIKNYFSKVIPNLNGLIGISRDYESFAKLYSLPYITIPSYLPDTLDNLEKFEPYPTDQQEFHIVTLGLWIPRENPLTLFEALRQVHNRGRKVRYTALGNVWNHPFGKKAMKSYARDSLLQEIIRLPGWVSEMEKNKILASANAFVLLRKDNLNTQGLFPTRLPEYLSQRRPVILSDAGDMAYYLHDRHSAIVIPPGDKPDELADAICYLNDHRREAQMIGEKGFADAVKAFSIEGNGQQMARFIETIDSGQEKGNPNKHI